MLVVEPDGDDRGGIADALRRKGLHTESAHDAARALACIEANHHAMIVVDPATPALDVEMLVDALRAAVPRPVVLVMIDRIAPPRGFAADVVHGYVRRGTDDEQLAELIRDCLAALKESGTAPQPASIPAVSLRPPQ